MVKNEKRRMEVYFLWIKEIITKIFLYTKWYDYDHFVQDQKTIDAVLMMLIQLWEVAFQIEHHYPKNDLSHIKALKAMRNFLVHAYHRIDTNIVWDTIQKDIPILLEEIKRLLNQNNK